MSWTRSEPRLARPFFAVSHLSDLFDNCSIMIGDKEYDSALDVISVEPEALTENSISVLLNLDVSRVDDIYSYRKNLVKLQIVLRDPMFKRRKIVFRTDLLEEAPSSLQIDADQVLEFSHGREIILILSAVLSEDVVSHPGMPSRVGEWVAKRTIKVAVPSQTSTFRIREMTPEQAKKWLGSEGALVYVEYTDGALTASAEEGVSVADCYVAKKLLDRLKGRSSPLVNSKISSEIIYRILRDGREEIKSITEVPLDSPLASVLKQLSAKRGVGLSELKAALDKPDWLRALLEDRFNLVDIISG